jgi:hypothetical protein
MSGTVCTAELQLDSLQDFCCILHLSVSRLTQELSNSANYFFPFCVTSHTTLFVKSLVQFFPNKCKTYSINNSKQHWLWSSNQTSLSLVFSWYQSLDSQRSNNDQHQSFLCQLCLFLSAEHISSFQLCQY